MKTNHSLTTGRFLTRARGALILAGTAMALAACTSTVEQHGHVLPERVISELKPGLVTRDGVVALLGTPSTVAPFDDKVWYYISEDRRPSPSSAPTWSTGPCWFCASTIRAC